MQFDKNEEIHKTWLGLIQPVVLVVSPLALDKAQAYVDVNKAIELQPVLKSIFNVRSDKKKEDKRVIDDFAVFAEQILGWDPTEFIKLSDEEEVPSELQVVLPDYGETLSPSYAVKETDEEWLLVIQSVQIGLCLDSIVESEQQQGWSVTPQAKFERLLRETQIPIGILFNGLYMLGRCFLFVI